MSKKLYSFLLIIGSAISLICSPEVKGQDVEAAIVVDGTGRMAQVEGRFLASRPSGEANKLSFLQSYGSMAGIGSRISEVHTKKPDGTKLALAETVPGDYQAASHMTAWSYRIDLQPLEYRESAAHLSWIDGDRGILVLDDILPQAGLKTARVKLDLPVGWKVFTTEQPIAANEYNIDDMEKAVFVIGRGWREKDIMSGKSRLRLLVAGDWLFSDDEAAAQAAEVFEHYQRLFRSAPEQPFQIAVTRFPVRVPIGNWEAGSRGSTITLVSSDMAFKSQSLQRLHEQLRHEIFHLWVPHGLALDGNYDWFYEGFALYESLKLGVSVNRIRFEDMLETLSRAYAADSRVPDGVFGKRQSLIAASEGRWSGSNTTVYARGMLVAFLCDLAALDASKGKRTISDDLRNVYERHRAPGPTHDANAAVLAVLRKHPELVPVIDSYITGDQKINWGSYLHLAGLEAVPAGNSPNLRVAAKLTGRQKQLLNKLGYNNWRKMASNNR